MSTIQWGTFIVLLSTLMVLIRVYFRKKYSYWKRLGIKSVPTGTPFGSLSDLFLGKVQVSELLARFYNEGKGEKYVGLYGFVTPILLIRDPEIIKNILVKDFDNFADRGIYYNEAEDPCSAHLFSIEGEKWKNLRAKISPTFTSGKMKTMYETIKSCNRLLLDTVDEDLERTDVFDLTKLSKRYGLNVIAKTAFAIEGHNMKEDTEFSKMTFKITEPNLIQSLRIIIPFFCRDLGEFFRIRLTPKDVGDYFCRLVTEIMDYRKNTNTRRNDFMQLLIDLNDSDDISTKNAVSMKMTRNQMVAQAFVFIQAGYETTSGLTSYLLYELAANPELQDKLIMEIDEVGNLEDLSYETLKELPYLDMVMEETLRKHPPVGFLQRVSAKEYELPGGQTLEAGTIIFIPVKGIHSDPEFFPDPEIFNPERFNKKNPAHKIIPFTNMPFGEGPRFCIGLRFAKLQSKLAVFSLLSRYRFEISEKMPEYPKPDPKAFSLNALGGMWLRIVKRK